MYDATSVYRSTQVTSSGPGAQIVLLYQGALRFGTQHLAALERGDIEAAHAASIRCQAIVSGLQEVLDFSAGPVAERLDSLYDFCLRRLVEGNMRKDPRATAEALVVLRGLLDAWHEITRVAATSTPQVIAVPTSVVPIGSSLR